MCRSKKACSEYEVKFSRERMEPELTGKKEENS
jgi:hypothetical protein